MTEKQFSLDGKVLSEDSDFDEEGLDVIKSALQKCVRRGMADSAMYFALRLAEKSSFMVWKRLFQRMDPFYEVA